jgi:hypothetical protein
MGSGMDLYAEAKPAQIFYYRAFGLTIKSALACPELLPQYGAPEVSIRFGPVPEDLGAVQQQGVCYQINSEAFLLKLESIAKYLVTGGKEIIIEPAPGAQDNEVRLFLLGSAFAALLHQRGLLPLHGCAIEVNGGAMVFVGASGSGKSTLAGALQQRGYRVLADDVCVLSFSSEGIPVVHPSTTHLKLWADVLSEFGQSPEGLPRVNPKLEKYSFPLNDGFCAHSRHVLRVYQLTTHNARDIKLIPLHGMDKLTVLMGNTYRPRFLVGSLRKKLHFEQCGSAVHHFPVSRITRPHWPFLLRELVDLVEQEWA